jgi:uncharacterized membrane protein YkvA (DUF1232 family)
MNSKSLRVSFTLEENDLKYFRGLHRKAKKEARGRDSDKIIKEVEALIKKVRKKGTMPTYLIEAMEILESLILLLHDKEYAAPKGVSRDIVATLAYFAHDEDLIPDDIPGLGYLADAIMIKFVQEEVKEERWA